MSALTLALLVAASFPSLGASSCGGGDNTSTPGSVASNPLANGIVTGAGTGGSSAGGGGTSGGIGGTVAGGNSSQSVINAVQIITKADPAGSFDSVSVPSAGGTSVRASRYFNLDGSLITVGNLPPWFIEARAFLTSTRTSTGTPSNIGSDTPCSYFDSFAGDNNPDSNGFYTIDGYNTDQVSTDIDQCAGVAASEASQIGIYIRLDRRFMGPGDKIQLIVKAKPIDEPNTTITPSSCVTNGFFDPSACANQLYTVTMRAAPNASAKPFYILFPSAKSFDLLSESVLLPVNIDQSLTTISIDRVKGGAIFYGISVIRLQ